MTLMAPLRHVVIEIRTDDNRAQAIEPSRLEADPGPGSPPNPGALVARVDPLLDQRSVSNLEKSGFD